MIEENNIIELTESMEGWEKRNREKEMEELNSKLKKEIRELEERPKVIAREKETKIEVQNFLDEMENINVILRAKIRADERGKLEANDDNLHELYEVLDRGRSKVRTAEYNYNFRMIEGWEGATKEPEVSEYKILSKKVDEIKERIEGKLEADEKERQRKIRFLKLQEENGAMKKKLEALRESAKKDSSVDPLKSDSQKPSSLKS